MQPNLEEPQQPKTGAVRSMTGYGRARQLIGNKEITVEIRSVNHRFLEYSSRVPRAYAYLEEKLIGTDGQIKLDEKGKAVDADIISGCTIDLTAISEAINIAIDEAK